MEMVLLLLLILLILTIALAVFVPSFRWIAVIIASVLLYIPSLLAWAAMRYFNVVRIEDLLNVYTHQLVGTWLGSLLHFGPPLLPSIVLLSSFFLVRRFKQDGESTTTH